MRLAVSLRMDQQLRCNAGKDKGIQAQPLVIDQAGQQPETALVSAMPLAAIRQGEPEFVLPLEAGSVAVQSVRRRLPTHAARRSEAMNQAPVKCLLVDDLEANLLALSALLGREDVEILTARSGREALELLLEHEVALALLDVQMPEMDGFQLAELMRGSERTRHIPLIFVTATSRDQHRQFKGYETGAVDFLYKPVESHILKSKAEVFFQLYRQKQQLAQELHERSEALRLNEMFMAVLGHDLRDPLHAIVLSVSLLQSQTSDPKIRKTADLVLASGMRMTRMIEDLLEAARTRQGGGIPVRPERTDLGQLLQRVVDECRAGYPGRQAEIQVQGDPHGDWDPDRMGQMVANLVGNAFSHGESAMPLQVLLDGSRADQVLLSFASAGRIAPELLPHIFDPFRSGQGRSGRGLGLGLYIVQQIVLAHGGSIEVHSGEDQRIRFELRLPRRTVVSAR